MAAKSFDVPETATPSKARAPAVEEHATETTTLPRGVLVPTFVGSPGDAVDPRTLRWLQRTVGNGETERFVQRQVAPPAPAPAKTAPTATPPAAAPQTKKPPTDRQLLADDAWVNATVEGFQSFELRKQIGGKLPGRRAFLQGMRRYLGSLSGVVSHFKQIRPVTIPKFGGGLHLHEKAASRLEAVNAELHGRLPATSVALGIRGDYLPKDKTHKYETIRRTMHCFGFAIDVRATSNPQIRALGLRTLIKLVTGETSSTMNLGLEDSKRRALIRKAGAAERTEEGTPKLDEPDKAAFDALLARVDSEYTRLSAASRKLTTELPPNVLAYKDLRAGRGTLAFQLQRAKETLGALQKKKKIDPKVLADQQALVEKLEGDRTQNAKDIAQTEGDLPLLFEDWLTTINERTSALEADVATIDKGLSMSSRNFKEKYEEKKSLAKNAIDRAKGRLAELGKTKRTLDARRTSGLESAKKLAPRLKAVRDSIAAETGKEKPNARTLANLGRSEKALAASLKGEEEKAAQAEAKLKQADLDLGAVSEVIDAQRRILADIERIVEIAKEWGPLDELRRDLGDRKFVLKGNSNVEDPAAIQLLEQGFFTPDPEPADAKSFDPEKHGYDLAFFKAMIEHGFDPGISWGEGGADPMHFELVEGTDGILDANRPGADNLDTPEATPTSPAPVAAAATEPAEATLAAPAIQPSPQRDITTPSSRGLQSDLETAPAGRALDAGTRAELEDALGADLSRVRVHSDPEANQLSKSVGATAFTSGQDIFFRSGAYAPGTPDGRHLLAHEVTHTVQQAAGPVAGTVYEGGIRISDPSDPFERAAEAVADRVSPRIGLSGGVQALTAPPSGARATGTFLLSSANRALQRRAEGASTALQNPRFQGIPGLDQIAAGGGSLSPADSAAVHVAQSALIALGYLIPSEWRRSKYGPETREAIKLFNANHHIAGAELNAESLRALDRATPPPKEVKGRLVTPPVEHPLDYERLFADGRLDITVAAGFIEEKWQDSNLEAEPGSTFIARRVREWLSRKKFEREAKAGQPGYEHYVLHKRIRYLGHDRSYHEKDVAVHVNLIVPHKGAASEFARALNESEVTAYMGHARGGLGPDFDHIRSALENFVIGNYSSLHRSGALSPGINKHAAEVITRHVNDLERLTKSGGWDEKKYRVWLFNACSSLLYLRGIRGGLLPDGMSREQLDVFGTRSLAPGNAATYATLVFLDGLLEARSAEEIVAGMSHELVAYFDRIPELPKKFKAEIHNEFSATYFHEGAADSPSR